MTPEGDLRELLARQARELDALMQVGQALSTASNLERLLQMVADEARNLMEARLCTIMLVTEDGESLELVSTSGSQGSDIERRAIPIAESLTGQAVLAGRPLVVENVQAESTYHQKAMAQAEGLSALLSVPIVHEGLVIGVVNVYPEELPEARDRTLMMLAAFASQAGVAIASARRLERIIQTESMFRQSERMALLGMLSAEIAHEVRNPITVIQMLLQAVIEEPTLGDGIRQDLNMVLEKLDDIEKIVSRTLEMASTQEGESAPIQLPDVADNVLRMLEHRLREKDVTVERDYVQTMRPILADRVQIQQVLLNLLLNAVQAMRKNEEVGRKKVVRVSLRETTRDGQPGIEASVRDSGPGIAEELANRLFQPFVSGRRKGTGLGLYICNKIIAKHLGVLRMQNNVEGSGCTMSFWLPVHSKSEAED